MRTDRIGDVIMTLPMVDVITANFPEAEIDFLVNKRVSELVSEYPNINKVIAIEKETVSDIRRICKENGYDLAIVVSPRFSVAFGLFLGNVRLRLGTRNRWYSFLFSIRHAQHRKHSIKSEMTYNLDMLDEINCFRIKDLKPSLNVKDEYIEKVDKRLSRSGISSKSKFVVVHVPTKGSAKVWSDTNFIRLIDKLGELDIDIVLTGTNEDKQQLEFILSSIAAKKRVFLFTDLSLNELAALIKHSALFIGNSSGPIHIAAAVGVFIVGLYSPVTAESPIRWGPVTDRKKIFVPEKDDSSRNVMDDIKPEVVFDFVKEYLSKNMVRS